MTGPGCGPAGETEGLALVDFEIQVSVGHGSVHPSWQLLRRLSQTGSLLELRSDAPAWPHGETLPQMQRKGQSVSLESASPAHGVTLQLLAPVQGAACYDTGWHHSDVTWAAARALSQAVLSLQLPQLRASITSLWKHPRHWRSRLQSRGDAVTPRVKKTWIQIICAHQSSYLLHQWQLCSTWQPAISTDSCQVIFTTASCPREVGPRALTLPNSKITLDLTGQSKWQFFFLSCLHLISNAGKVAQKTPDCSYSSSPTVSIHGSLVPVHTVT